MKTYGIGNGNVRFGVNVPPPPVVVVVVDLIPEPKLKKVTGVVDMLYLKTF